MSLLNIKKLLIIVEDEESQTDITLDLEKVPTFETIYNALNDVISTAEVTDDSIGKKKMWYFLSQTDRYLCSSEWAKGQTFLYQLLHKNEILEAGHCLQIKATTIKPRNCYVYFVRVLNGTLHELEASPYSTIRECRYQLGQRGGPWGEDPRWLYGGTLMESGHTLEYYGVRSRDTMDIVLRLRDQCQIRPLEKRDPIAVDDSDKPIDTACLIRKDPPKNKNPNHAKQRELVVQRQHRGGTILRGKVNQQFVEVDPIEIDDRFLTTLLVSLLPDDDIAFESEDEEEKSSKACVVM